MAVQSRVRYQYENMFRREMLRILTPAETKAMVFIIDRTLGWMKSQARIAYDDFEYGCATSSGAGINRSTAIRCVKGLVDKGILTLDACKKHGTLYILNLKWEIGMLKIPKKQRVKKVKLGDPDFNSTVEKESGSCILPLRKSHPSPTSSRNLPPPYIIKSNKKVISEKDSQSDDWQSEPLQPVSKSNLPDTIETAISAGKEKQYVAVTKKRNRVKKNAASGNLRPGDLEQAWKDGLSDANLGFRNWKMQELGQAKHLLKLGLDAKVIDFVSFCAASWPLIISAQFKWAESQLQSNPNIGFVLKYVDQFKWAFDNQSMLTAQAGVSSEDALVNRMKRKGFTEESAREEIELNKERRANKTASKRTSRPARPTNRVEEYRKRTRSAVPDTPVIHDTRPTKEYADMMPLDSVDLGEWK